MSHAQSSPQELSKGTDRAALHVYDPIASHPRATLSQHVGERAGVKENGNTTTRRRSKSAGVKAKIRKIFHHGPESHGDSQETPILASQASDTGDNDRLFMDVPKTQQHTLKEIVHDPIQVIQSQIQGKGGKKLAATLSGTAIVHGADVQLVRAYDKVKETSNEEGKADALEEFDELKDNRQDSFVRWTMDHHVHKVKRIEKKTIQLPERKDFVTPREDSHVRFPWMDYAGHVAVAYAEYYGDRYVDVSSELPLANEDTITASAERLLLASLQVQDMLVAVRRIYRWNDWVKTCVYAISYFGAWAFDLIGIFSVLLGLWIVLSRRLNPDSIEDMRENIKRTEDTKRTARNITELVNQHGAEGWLEFLVSNTGPTLMLQLEDMADLLERLTNFYEWRDPWQTTTTLFSLSLVFLAVALIPAWSLIKGSQFFAGIVFFGLFPISSHFPRYRLLISPTTWAFWGIPTHAEWAIARIESEAIYHKKSASRIEGEDDPAQRLSNASTINPTKGTVTEPSSDDPVERDRPIQQEGSDSSSVSDTRQSSSQHFEVGEYPCKSGKHYGKLCVSSVEVSFVTSVRSHERWKLRYTALKSMQKLMKPMSLGNNAELKFIDINDEEFVVSGVKNRDEVFTQIIGFSGQEWRKVG